MNTLIKSTALVAALALGSTSAVAATNFGFQGDVNDDSSITLDLINSDTDGFVVIYNYNGGEFGDMIGQAPINAGANADVIVPIEATNDSNLAAVVYSDEVTNPAEAVAWIELDVSDNS